jgi:hypothetical protein
VDETGMSSLVRPEVARAKLLELIANLPPCLMASRQSATSQSLDVQSVPSFTAASNHANAGIPFIKEEDRMQKTKSCA